MKTSTEIRFENLEILLSEFAASQVEKDLPLHGRSKRFAAQVDVDAAYLSHIRCGRKNIGDAYARQLEAGSGKPVGWLDHDHQVKDITKERAIILENLFHDALGVSPQKVARSLLQVLRSSHKLAHSARASRYEQQLK
jgi:hypothetical protein